MSKGNSKSNAGTSEFLRYFPKPLLDDLIAGRWLPIVGAGMSRNAIVPAGKKMPLWDDLGRELAAEMDDYPYSGALDAISAYSHEYGRSRLVEKIADAILIADARPGDPHRAFCSIPFDIVCTTNFDFLLERQYEKSNQYCRPVIDEDHLAVNERSAGTLLLKLHSDVHHPGRLVLTEADYDSFLTKYPLLATYLANLLITRTAVFIGYSLDDPDFRQIWQVIGDRLGKARRLAYAIMVDAKSTDISRFERRGVRVISLPAPRSEYARVLATTFDELREYLPRNLIRASQATEEEPLSELSLPSGSTTRLCFFAVPLTLQPQYRDQVFPLAERCGLVPVTATDVIAPGDNYSAKIDAIIRRSSAAVVDVATHNTAVELNILLERERPLLVVVEADTLLPRRPELCVVRRTKQPIAEQPHVLDAIDKWFRTVADKIRPSLAEEPTRLLNAREYRAAVISAVTYLESELRSNLEAQESLPKRVLSVGPLLDLALSRGLLSGPERKRLHDWLRIRNSIVHTGSGVTRAKAAEIVKGVQLIAGKIGI